MKSKAMNFSRYGRYEEAIKMAAFKKALAASIKKNPERKACKAGHDNAGTDGCSSPVCPRPPRMAIRQNFLFRLR